MSYITKQQIIEQVIIPSLGMYFHKLDDEVVERIVARTFIFEKGYFQSACSPDTFWSIVEQEVEG